MLTPKAKKRFRRYTANLFHRSSSTPILDDTSDVAGGRQNSFCLTPRTPQAFREIPEDEIERVKRLRGGGSGCMLWIARVDGWSCCLKEIELNRASKREMDEFEKEVQVLSKITKPARGMPTHLVQFLGCQRTPHALQLFMTLYEGNLFEVLGNLRSFKRPMWLEERRIARYASQLLRGLNILHHRNILHRDIKSPNIFYTALESWDGTPRPDSPRSGIFPETLVLGDFGEAKILCSEKSKAKTCRGTTSWIAPEVLEAGLVDNYTGYSLAADIWSLGMVVYEMMTLLRPYSDVSQIRAFACVQEGILPTLEEAVYKRYPTIIKVWHRMVKRDPTQRPKVGEVLLMFRDIAECPPIPDYAPEKKELERDEDETEEESDKITDDEEESTSHDETSSTESIHMVEK